MLLASGSQIVSVGLNKIFSQWYLSNLCYWSLGKANSHLIWRNTVTKINFLINEINIGFF